jgi:Mn2+/Fe2+ NRAMP family transporter
VWALVAGVVTTALLMSGSFHRIALIFKLLCLSLLTYVVVLFLVHPHWSSVASHVFLPRIRFSAEYLSLLVAFLGTTIAPYLFFWQSAHRVEELREEDGRGSRPVRLEDRSTRAAEEKLRASRLDVFAGMTFSNLVMFAIIVVSAETIGSQGHKNIASASEAATSLRPLAGDLAGTVFALGFIGTGMLAVPVLAASGAAGLAGLLGKSWGFSRSLRQAPTFYGLVLAGAIAGTLLSLVDINPIRLLVISALVNGVAAAPFLFVIVLIANDRQLMGDKRNHWLANTLGWATTAIMATGAIVLIALSV